MPEPRSTRSEILGALLAGIIVVFFCLLLLWHDPLLFWNDDYELSVLPVFADMARSWNEGQWPLLSPYSWVCSNLAGEFQYGTFSIFVNAAVVLIWKFPLTFPQQAAALSITHLFVLAAGAFLLARDRLRHHEKTGLLSPELSPTGRGERRSCLVRDSSISLSIFVGLVAALNGWIICWGAIDWFGALGAFAWLPWAWWGLERALDPERSGWKFLWPGPFVYLVVTGGFPYTVVMLALLIVWLSIRTLARTQRLTAILPMLFGTAFGFGLSAPAWLAIFDYVRGSGREVQPATAHWQWIVPVTALPGLFLPCWTVNWADFSTRYVPHAGSELTCGLVPPAALIAGFMIRARALVRQIGWELVLLVLVLVISVLPSAGMFRWSFRWLPFFHLILAMCAAEALRQEPGPTAPAIVPGKLIHPGIVAFGAVGITAAAMLLFRTSGKYAFPLTWILLGIAAAWALLDFRGRAAALSPEQRTAWSLRQPWLPVVIALAALFATYFCIPPNCGVPKYNLSQELLKPGPLDPARLYLSIYPPVEYNYRTEIKPGPIGQIVRPGSISMWGRLRFINGYSPILAAGVAREFKFAIHGEIDPEMGWRLLDQQAGADGGLARLGVDGIAVAAEVGMAPQPSSEWELVASAEEGRVYHRRSGPFAPVRAVAAIDSRPNERFADATISNIQDSRNCLQADVDVANAARPALLTFSRPFFRGYVARLGHDKLRVDSHRGLFPVVEVPGGSRGRLILSYRPWWLVIGSAVATCCAAFFLAAIVMACFVERRSSPPAPDGGQSGRSVI